MCRLDEITATAIEVNHFFRIKLLGKFNQKFYLCKGFVGRQLSHLSNGLSVNGFVTYPEFQ